LPSGTVTFLFTDMVDSTLLWEEQPEAMSEARGECDAMLAEAVEDHDGHVVKSTGDGLMAVFSDAGAAAGAAVDALRRIAEADWPVPIEVRMGVHTGTAGVDAGDYHAPAVNRAARVADAAHPGQLLVSDATAALIDDVELRDLGEHRLRGLAPMRLHQVLHPGLRADFPPTTTTVLAGLPAPTTRFVGRRGEAETIGRLLDQHRLVTLTGAGGCGKTRLALEAVGDLVPRFVDGVRFVDLAAVTDQAGVTEAVSDALGLAASLGTIDPRERLVAHLITRELLVLLDNCEHLLDACADLVDAVLAVPGSTRILATSREQLGVMGEQVLRVPSLPIESDSVVLFTDRARAVRADLAVDPTEATAVEQICRRLDGIPLAIELAAARASHLSPTQMLDRLDDRFRLLTGGRRRIQRQQTLAATLDWSYDLLTEDDREAFEALAAFPASFSLEAAEAVVGRDDTLERLGSLVDKSLLQVVDDEQRLRYRMLETVRLYAGDKLVASGDAAACRSRHSRWVHDWLESIPLEQRWVGDLDLLSTDLHNVRAAIEWSANEGDLKVTARIAAGVDWSRTEAWSDGARWCETLGWDESLDEELRFRLLFMRWWLGPLTRTNELLGRHLVELARDAPPQWQAMALCAHARDLMSPQHPFEVIRQNRDEAIEAVEAAVEQCAGASQAWQMGCALWAGLVHHTYRQTDKAASLLAAATAEPPRAPYLDLHGALRGLLALTLLASGELERAAAIAREVCSPGALTPYWHHPRALSLVALAGTGDLAVAKQALREYHEASRQVDWIYARESVPLLGGALAGVVGDWPTASRLLAAGQAAMRRTPSDYLLYATFRDRAREQLGGDEARRLRAEGLAMPIEQAIDLALDLPG
jgi:predicted ATPase/class 3 adenylate cyclase